MIISTYSAFVTGKYKTKTKKHAKLRENEERAARLSALSFPIFRSLSRSLSLSLSVFLSLSLSLSLSFFLSLSLSLSLQNRRS